jgi:hypothetical protein
MGVCCWARAAGLKLGLAIRSAASAIAVKPSFTGISNEQGTGNKTVDSEQWPVKNPW